jgi:hypothetical protein
VRVWAGAPEFPNAKVVATSSPKGAAKDAHETVPSAATADIELPVGHVPVTRRCNWLESKQSRLSAFRLATFVPEFTVNGV